MSIQHLILPRSRRSVLIMFDPWRNGEMWLQRRGESHLRTLLRPGGKTWEVFAGWIPWWIQTCFWCCLMFPLVVVLCCIAQSIRIGAWTMTEMLFSLLTGPWWKPPGFDLFRCREDLAVNHGSHMGNQLKTEPYFRTFLAWWNKLHSKGHQIMSNGFCW